MAFFYFLDALKQSCSRHTTYYHEIWKILPPFQLSPCWCNYCKSIVAELNAINNKIINKIIIMWKQITTRIQTFPYTADPLLFLFVLLISIILLEDKNFPITPRIIPMKDIIKANIPTANTTVELLFVYICPNSDLLFLTCTKISSCSSSILR